MIIDKAKFNVYTVRRWKRGDINLKPAQAEKLGWKSQEVIMVVFKLDEELNPEVIAHQIAIFKKKMEIEKEIEELER